MENNNEDVLTMKEFKREAFKKRIKEFVRNAPGNAARTVKKTWDENRELILFGAPALAFGLKQIVKANENKKEDYHRNRQVYDQSLGMWHDLKRTMSAKEKAEYAKRRKDGESVLSILTSMRLLKR